MADKNYDKIVTTEKAEYGIATVEITAGGKKIPAVTATNLSNNNQVMLRPSEFDKESGEVINAQVNPVTNNYPSTVSLAVSSIDPAVRGAMAESYRKAMDGAEVGLAEEVLENFVEGKTSLKAPPYEERQRNDSYRNIVRGSDLDAEAAETIANERQDMLLEKLSDAMKAGDKDAIDAAKADLKKAQEQQPELDEAAAMLAKPKDHFMRQDFEMKHAVQTNEAALQEAENEQKMSHAARIEAERTAKERGEEEGHAR